MRPLRNIAFSALLTIGTFTAVTYTSCTKDECKDVVCQNGGTCISGTCSCPTGYEGSNCQTLSRDKFVGTYIGTEQCTSGTDAYTIVLAASSGALNLTFTNIYNQGYTATCTVTGKNTFSFSGSQLTTSFTGNGTLNGNQLTVAYQITSPAANNSCTFTGNK